MRRYMHFKGWGGQMEPCENRSASKAGACSKLILMISCCAMFGFAHLVAIMSCNHSCLV